MSLGTKSHDKSLSCQQCCGGDLSGIKFEYLCSLFSALVLLGMGLCHIIQSTTNKPFLKLSSDPVKLIIKSSSASLRRLLKSKWIMRAHWCGNCCATNKTRPDGQ